VSEVSKYLAAIGRRGGKAKGGAKADTARANGKLGGRPKKPKRALRRSNAQVRHGSEPLPAPPGSGAVSSVKNK